ncbi:hypothetical protein M8C21_004796, partial [Ambrosia artemisiifolia]
NHAQCIMKKAKQIKSCDNVEGIETLRWEVQQKIRQYVESGGTRVDDFGVYLFLFNCIPIKNHQDFCKGECNGTSSSMLPAINPKPEGTSHIRHLLAEEAVAVGYSASKKWGLDTQ